MRKITLGPIAVFIAAMALTLALTLAVTLGLVGRLPLGDWRGVALAFVGLLLFVVLAIAVHRLLLRLAPLRPGKLEPGSRQEFVFNVYVLFYLVVFNSVMRSGLLPVPLLRLFYQALGARLGANSYSSGIIFDPLFVSVGSNCILGQSSMLIPHVIEGGRLEIQPIRLGDSVTVSANAIVLAGVSIGDHAIVAAGAVVPKGTRIGPGEVWGGIPARRLKPKMSVPPDSEPHP